MAKKYFILALLLLMALGSYQYAFSQAIVIFIVLGLIFDMTFWFSITGKKKVICEHKVTGERLTLLSFDYCYIGVIFRYICIKLDSDKYTNIIAKLCRWRLQVSCMFC